MRHSELITAEHAIIVRAAATDIYRLLADIKSWPWIFPSFVHTQHLGLDDGSERIGMWTTSNGEVRHWVALRVLHRDVLRIDFRLEVCPPGLATMSRSWIVESRSEQEAIVRLHHEYRPTDDDAETLDQIAHQIDHISDEELSACKATAEQRAEQPELLMLLDDTEHIAGAAHDVYAFLRDVEHWPQRIPHVARVSVQGDTPDMQTVGVDIIGSRGVFPTKAARVCIPNHTIVQKQLLLPPVGSAHHTRWSIEETSDGVTLTTRHTVVINFSAISTMFGPDADINDAHKFVHREVGDKSRTILNQAKNYAEKRRSGREMTRNPRS